MKTLRFLALLPLLSLLLLVVAHAAGPLEGPGSSGVPGIINYQGRVTVQGVNFTGTGQFRFALVDGGVNQSSTAQAFASVAPGGMITSVFLISGGFGYASAPAVTITGTGGNGATATAHVMIGPGASSRNVDSITITNPGSGYDFNFPVTVTIAPPPPNILNITYWSNDSTSAQGSAPAAAVTLGVNAGLYAVPLGDTSLANMQTIPASVFQNPDVRLRVWFDDGTHGSQLLTPDQRITSVGYAMMASTVGDGAITSAKLANGAVGSSQLASGAVGAEQIASGAIAPSQLAGGATPQAGQVLSYDATTSSFNWVTAGLSLPFNGGGSLNGNVSTALLRIANAGTAPGIAGQSTAGVGLYGFSTQSDGVFGQVFQNTASGVYGRSDTLTSGQGVYGYAAANGVGVLGVSEGNDGISGRSNALGKSGVFGFSAKTNSAGVTGSSMLHHGVYATTASTDHAALWANAANGAEAVHGHSDGGDGVVGYTGAANKSGVFGLASRADNYAAFFYNSDPNGTALKVDGKAQFTGAITANSLNVNNLLTSDALYGTEVKNGLNVWTGGTRVLETLGGVPKGLVSNEKFFCSRDIEVHGNIIHFGAIQNMSDARLKDISGDFPLGLDEITRLETLRYKFKPGSGAPASEPRVGVTAQALREVMPEAVQEGRDGYLTMSTEPVFWAMVNSIKQLKAENDALRKRLDAVEAREK